MTEAEVRSKIRSQIEKWGLRSLARIKKLDHSNLRRAVVGDKPIQPAILRAFGFQRKTSYDEYHEGGE